MIIYSYQRSMKPLVRFLRDTFKVEPILGISSVFA